MQDLATLGRRYGMSTVHLRLAFARGLHPFYPPSLEVSRSQGCPASLTSLPTFRVVHLQMQLVTVLGLRACLEKLRYLHA